MTKAAKAEKPEVFVLDFEKVKPKNIKGIPMQFTTQVHQEIADAMYDKVPGYRGLQLVEKIFHCKGKKTELNQSEKMMLTMFVKSDNCTLIAPLVKALLEVLE